MAFSIYFVGKKKNLPFILLVWLKVLISSGQRGLVPKGLPGMGDRGCFTAAFQLQLLLYHSSLPFVFMAPSVAGVICRGAYKGELGSFCDHSLLPSRVLRYVVLGQSTSTSKFQVFRDLKMMSSF